MPSVVVIGGGPAGCVAGLLLARRGFSVELIEQHTFPRDKVCGECLSALGIDVLRGAGLDVALRRLEPVELVRTLLHPLSEPALEVPLPRVMWGLTRQAMDAVLLDAAAAEGVVVHQPARCERIGQGSVGWRDLSTNIRAESAADWIIVADGKGSLLGRSPAATGDLGIKTHFECINGPCDAIELFAGFGHYGGLAAVEGGRWNAAFSVPAARVRAHGGDLQSLFDQVVSEIPALAERMRGARRCSAWLASPLPRFAVERAWPERVIPIGNAAAALEPVGGEGMGLALRSAEMAVEAVVACERDGNLDPVRQLPACFNQLWQVRRTVCRGIAKLFSSPVMADTVAPLMAGNPRITSVVMRWAGK